MSTPRTPRARGAYGHGWDAGYEGHADHPDFSGGEPPHGATQYPSAVEHEAYHRGISHGRIARKFEANLSQEQFQFSDVFKAKINQLAKPHSPVPSRPSRSGPGARGKGRRKLR